MASNSQVSAMLCSVSFFFDSLEDRRSLLVEFGVALSRNSYLLYEWFVRYGCLRRIIAIEKNKNPATYLLAA